MQDAISSNLSSNFTRVDALKSTEFDAHFLEMHEIAGRLLLLMAIVAAIDYFAMLGNSIQQVIDRWVYGLLFLRLVSLLLFSKTISDAFNQFIFEINVAAVILTVYLFGLAIVFIVEVFRLTLIALWYNQWQILVPETEIENEPSESTVDGTAGERDHANNSSSETEVQSTNAQCVCPSENRSFPKKHENNLENLPSDELENTNAKYIGTRDFHKDLEHHNETGKNKRVPYLSAKVSCITAELLNSCHLEEHSSMHKTVTGMPQETKSSMVAKNVAIATELSESSKTEGNINRSQGEWKISSLVESENMSTTTGSSEKGKPEEKVHCSVNNFDISENVESVYVCGSSNSETKTLKNEQCKEGTVFEFEENDKDICETASPVEEAVSPSTERPIELVKKESEVLLSDDSNSLESPLSKIDTTFIYNRRL